jgi:hypothetical protein
VAGQLCKVYSIEIDGYISYYWFSIEKGLDILYQAVSSEYPEIYVMFTYEDTKVNKDAAFYDPSKQGVVTWEEETYD